MQKQFSMLSRVNQYKITPVPYSGLLCPVFLLTGGGGSLLKHLGWKRYWLKIIILLNCFQLHWHYVN